MNLKKNLLNSKRGTVMDFIAPIVSLFTFIFMIVFARLLYNNMIAVYISSGYVSSDAAIGAVAGFTRGMNAFDYIGGILLIVFVVALAVSNYKVNASPIFFWVNFLFASFLGFVSYFFNYALISMLSVDIFSLVLVSFPISILIASNFHWIALLFFAVGNITLYAKRDKGQYV